MPLRSARSARPLTVSVIMPVHDLEEYVEEAVRSVLDQTYTHLEVLVLDDGSTDRTGEIVRQLAAEDPRLTVVTVEQRGVAACRNLALSMIGGELVTYADGDDVVPPDAYRVMVDALTSSDADVVTGRALRFDETHEWQVDRYRRSHTRERLGITLAELPELVVDQFVWNKIFRRSFIDRIGLTFREGVSYSDMHPISRALMEADRIAVVRAFVYRWRRREGSITQNRQQSANMVQRFEAVDATLELVAGHAAFDVEIRRKMWQTDLLPLTRAAASMPDDQRALLESYVRTRWADHGAVGHDVLRDRERLLYAMTAAHGAVAAGKLDAWLADHLVPAVAHDGKLVVDQSSLPPGTPVVPADARELSDAIPAAQLDAWSWTGDDLVIDGQVRMPPTTMSQPAELTLVLTAKGATFEVAKIGKGPFGVRLDANALVAAAGSAPGRTIWQLELRAAWHELARSTPLLPTDGGGSVRAIGARMLADDVQVVPIAAPRKATSVTVRRPHVVVKDVRISGRRVEISLAGAGVAEVRLAGGEPKVRLAGAVSGDADGWVASWDLPEGDNIERRLGVLDANGKVLIATAAVPAASGGTLSAATDRQGILTIRDRPRFIGLTSWSVDSGGLTATGQLSAEDDVRLGLVDRTSGGDHVVWGELIRTDTAITWALDRDALGPPAGTTRLDLVADLPGWEVECLPEAIALLPAKHADASAEWETGVRTNDTPYVRVRQFSG